MTEQAAKGTTPSIHSYFFFHGEAAAAFTTAVGRRSNAGELRFVTRLKMLRLIPFISSVSPPFLRGSFFSYHFSHKRRK
jgi:hypothetical protein